MGSCREIVTFQFGNYSNYIGAHWWNIQESSFQYDQTIKSEICHDVLFREGQSVQGHVTFTPRLILVDSKDNLNYVPVLRDEPNETSIPCDVSKEFVKPPTKHDYQCDLEQADLGQAVPERNYNFSSTVTTWCDYLRTRYHPNSVVSAPSSGVADALRGIDEVITERLRVYVEECDNVQGFQILSDATNELGYFSNTLLLHLNDEYGNKPRVTFLTAPGAYLDNTPNDITDRSIYTFLNYQKLSENSTVLVPLGTNETNWKTQGSAFEFPYLKYDNSVPYESSAILAAFIDTATLKYRSNLSRSSMHDLTTGLCFHNRRVSAATLTLPFPAPPDSYLFQNLEKLDDSVPFWTSLTPNASPGLGSTWFQNISVRGFSLARLSDPAAGSNHLNLSHPTAADVVKMYLSYAMSSTVSDVGSVNVPLTTAVPYPDIFNTHVSRLGSVDNDLNRVEGLRVDSAPVVSGLHSCQEVGDMLESLVSVMRKVNLKKCTRFSDVSVDEYTECLENLRTLRSAYDPCFDMDL